MNLPEMCETGLMPLGDSRGSFCYNVDVQNLEVLQSSLVSLPVGQNKKEMKAFLWDFFVLDKRKAPRVRG